MKSLARGYLWWPGMDKDIEECVKKCDVCQQTRKDPPAVPLHPWVWPDKPWTRVHIDYVGPLEENMFLLIADAHSKWIEIHATNSSTSSATIELLRKTFSSLGLPEVLVSDNATAFTSAEFSEFLQKNGICHVRTPPYHPASNGLVERAVQSFKEGMKRIRNFGTEGSVMYQIQLSDGRAVRHHADQLRSCVADGESRFPADNDIGDSFVPIELDGGIGEDQETETQLVNRTSDTNHH